MTLPDGQLWVRVGRALRGRTTADRLNAIARSIEGRVQAGESLETIVAQLEETQRQSQPGRVTGRVQKIDGRYVLVAVPEATQR